MQTADYSITELATIIKAALLVADTLDADQVDVIDQWIEAAEEVAWRASLELVSREPEDEGEAQERDSALSAYRARLGGADEVPARGVAELH